jgi:hypothetical protein
MSTNYNPKIITDNLVFYYDQANVQKSWKGAPTTNLLGTKSQDFTLWGSNATIVTPNATLAPDGTMTGALLTVNGTGGSRSIAVIGVVPAGGNYSIYLKAAGATTTCYVGVYTASAWSGGGSASVISGPGAIATDQSSLFSVTGLSYIDWTRVDIISTLAGHVYVYPKNTGNTIGDSNYVANAQVEAGSICSAFTSSNRSNTQALLDLTGNNIITANSLTYANDGSFSFNGTSNIITSSTTAFNRVNGDVMTVAAWIKPQRNAGQYQDIITSRSASYHNWILYQHTIDGSIQLHGENQNKSSYIPILNTWIYVVATVDSSGNSLLYINGIIQQTVTNYIYHLASPNLLSIGGYGNVSEPYLGNISVVQIYNRALSLAEIQQNFNATRSRYGV